MLCTALGWRILCQRGRNESYYQVDLGMEWTNQSLDMWRSHIKPALFGPDKFSITDCHKTE